MIFEYDIFSFLSLLNFCTSLKWECNVLKMEKSILGISPLSVPLSNNYPFPLMVKLIRCRKSVHNLFSMVPYFVTGLAAFGTCILGLQRPPPRYSQQYMPETSFTCRNKIVGSYYADPETDCQVFHVCVSISGIIQDYK